MFPWEALQMMQAAGSVAFPLEVLTTIGEALLVTGRPDEARAQVE